MRPLIYTAASAPAGIALVDHDDWIVIASPDGTARYYGHAGSFTSQIDFQLMAGTYRPATFADIENLAAQFQDQIAPWISPPSPAADRLIG